MRTYFYVTIKYKYHGFLNLDISGATQSGRIPGPGQSLLAAGLGAPGPLPPQDIETLRDVATIKDFCAFRPLKAKNTYKRIPFPIHKMLILFEAIFDRTWPIKTMVGRYLYDFCARKPE